MPLRDPQRFKSDHFYGEKTLAGRKAPEGPRAPKDVQSTTKPSSGWTILI